MSRVFFAQHSYKYDIGNAERFGQVTYLLPPTINHLKAEEVGQEIYRSLVKLDFKPDEDYLAFTGSIVLVSLLFMVASDYGKLKSLVYNYHTRKFVECTLDLDHWAKNI